MSREKGNNNLNRIGFASHSRILCSTFSTYKRIDTRALPWRPMDLFKFYFQVRCTAWIWTTIAHENQRLTAFKVPFGCLWEFSWTIWKTRTSSIRLHLFPNFLTCKHIRSWRFQTSKGPRWVPPFATISKKSRFQILTAFQCCDGVDKITASHFCL